jgi:predicted nucleic acid-binding protein
MNKININTYHPKNTDKFFFDNNVWMYLYCPLGNHNQASQKKYSDFFGKVLKSEATIYVSSMLLSEFYNSYSRLDFNIWRNGEAKDYKKHYRPTERFKETSEIILMTIESRILGVSQRLDDDFKNMSIEDINNKCLELDFNDSYYVELIKKNNCIMVTNDRDFLTINDDVAIVTAL